MTKVYMIVWNSFQNDARVLKEAQTLSRNNYNVRVHALHIPEETKRSETLEPRLSICRVSKNPLWPFSTHSKKKNKSDTSSSLIQQRLNLAILAASRLFAHIGLVARLAYGRPDIIHAHDINTLPTAWLAAKLCGAKLVYDAHEISTDREGYSSLRSFVAFVEKRLMPRADATITTTEMRAKFFARAWKIKRPLVLQNRPRLLKVKKTDRLKRELNLDKNLPIILYQGGLQSGRGLHDLIKTFQNVSDAYLVLIGGGRLAQSLEELIKSEALDERVFIIPTVPLDDLLDYTASADIGVQPLENTCLNHWTTDSNKLFEYAMAGLPVLASDFPEIRRILKQYDIGMLFDPADKSMLRDKLNEMISDASQREIFRLNALKHAYELSWESQEQSLIDLYKQLVK
ncbi:glycosyltransferase family 4 protein [Brucellaceae bacterium C25G]